MTHVDFEQSCSLRQFWQQQYKRNSHFPMAKITTLSSHHPARHLVFPQANVHTSVTSGLNAYLCTHKRPSYCTQHTHIHTTVQLKLSKSHKSVYVTQSRYSSLCCGTRIPHTVTLRWPTHRPPHSEGICHISVWCLCTPPPLTVTSVDEEYLVLEKKKRVALANKNNTCLLIFFMRHSGVCVWI